MSKRNKHNKHTPDEETIVQDAVSDSEEETEGTLDDAISQAFENPEAETEIADTETGVDEGEGGETDAADLESQTETKKDAPKEGDTQETKDNNADDKSDKENEAEADDEEISGLSERAQKRFQRLSQENREYRERVESSEAEVTQWRSIIQDVGAEPDEVAQTMQYLKLLKKGGREEMETALQMLDEQRTLLAKELGVDAPGVDVLADYPDLKQKVDDMALDRETALEVAKARRVEQSQQQKRQQTEMTAREQQQQQQVVAQAAQSLNTLGERLKASDPDFARKMEVLKKKTIPYLQQNVPPQQWAQAFEVAYESLGQVAPSVPNKRPQPLRQPGVSGGSQVQPASMDDVIGQALGGE
ncbi:MAG TPA: hypothetical protein VFP95_07150 [Gammaproteobacteria bacterium]|nr:hypothetical protein [Gammaproteobacteria bacterium]